ncbi:MAG: tRNA methyltransferase [Alphaproteobacteria bacterium 16-39-46]|nr:MAG: tRNA methyltransferase [Rhodospirillales bacterium 35-44-4]OYZ36071.1 MAG: tRNA methyltransferase [Alphaproteobacteria bacterium 16-39-46]HQS84949.1 tRNA (cytidine(34)-2'-O)-methyltransferase [Alphaproteobacteria bacterium]HQS94716.1 tRNA (cytidine(34)-2'-O)-methyltransferase [Alphaproteobacteria bacterium]
MRLVLYQPEIPQNAGTLLRVAACFGISVDMIEPFGFIFSERRMRRAGMDYIDSVNLSLHVSWKAFQAQQGKSRLILLTPTAPMSYVDFQFEKNDVLMVGRESDGVPEDVRRDCTHQISIPMRAGFRSLNVAVAASMVLGEALRQTGFEE